MLHCENFVPVPARSQIYLTKTAREPAALALALSKLAGEDTDWPGQLTQWPLICILYCVCVTVSQPTQPSIETKPVLDRPSLYLTVITSLSTK